MRLLVVGLLFLVACVSEQHHYALTAPPMDASPLIRMQAFQELRPAAEGSQTICNGQSCSAHKYLVLGNGMEIWDSEELAALVEPTSAAGRSVQELHAARKHHATWGTALLAGVIGGLAIAATGHESHSHTVTMAGLVVAGAAFTFGGFGWIATGATIREAKASIFDKYEDGLARRLNICTKGASMMLVPCDAPFAPMPQDPMLRSLPQR